MALTVRRTEDWPARLRAFLAARGPMPFAWGANDCCTFAADAVLAMTGVDPAAEWRGYKSKRGAAFRLKRAGGIDRLADTASGRHGWARIGPRFAARGDIVTVETENGIALAVVDLDGRRALCPGPAGSVAHDLGAAIAAWRIG